jgi:hypothetical protein
MKIALALLLLCGLPLAAQDMQSCPMHKDHKKEASQHSSAVERNGEHAMGFAQDKTTHHFRLAPDGGAIEVTVNDEKDSASLEAVRGHLKHIAMMFSNGDFSIPMLVHDQTPPGAAVMKEKRAQIAYGYEAMPDGGRVRIKTADPEALAAVREFLRFQIEEHHTHDAPDGK